MRRIWAICCLIAIIFVSACGQPGQEVQDIEEVSSSSNFQPAESIRQMSYVELAQHLQEESEFVSLKEAQQQFAFDLYRTLLADATAENVFISPLSINIALTMAMNGADGETLEQMQQTLQLEGVTLDEVNAAYHILQQLVQIADPDVELAIANSLWAKEGFQFEEDFLQRNQHYFGAKVSSLDFRQNSAAETINKWVAEQTRQKIEHIVTAPIKDNTILFLINAVYFKGDWSKPFNENATHEHSFYLSDGTVISHPLMSQNGTFDYLETDSFQAVRLPYGEEERMSMVVFLPDEKLSLEQFQEKLTVQNWNDWMSQFSKKQGTIQLPRFTFEYEKTLNEVLQSLGMTNAFSPGRAEFSNMITVHGENVYMNTVKHKSFIEVNEVGTEAAAVTSIEMSVTSAVIDAFFMSINRPFFFAITDEATGTILFIGSIEHPGRVQ